MCNRLEQVEKKVAKVESRLESHWALQTEDDFAKRYVESAKNEIQVSIIKLALAVIALLAGAGFVFIKYAVNQTFQEENKELISKLESSYNKQVTRTDDNFEWRRFHDYGKDYVYLAKLYSLAPLDKAEKEKHIRGLFSEALGYFKKSLAHGDMHASTYWELGELRYSYPLSMELASEVDILEAVTFYKEASNRYTRTEIENGWRAETYYKIGACYFDLTQDKSTDNKLLEEYKKHAKEYLQKADDGYSKIHDQNDERTRSNIEHISKLFKSLEKNTP